MFVKELEQALLDGRADLAVHSAKDLPTELPPGLAVVATPARADARDVLVGASALDDLAAGARVGTGSPRRQAQLRSVRSDLEVVAVRGNVGTRLDLVDRGDIDALVLAAAGLARLGVTRGDVTHLPEDVCTPAAGQGILALEGRSDDAAVRAALHVIDHAPTRLCLDVEREVLTRLGGGCFAPVGAFCRPDGEHVVLTVFRASDADADDAVRVSLTAHRDRAASLVDDAVAALAVAP